MSLPTFGFIAEGITDYAVLENILIGVFNDYDITAYIQELQPATSDLYATDAMGGWSRAINYCKGEVFANECVQKDFIIIALDTDFIHEIGIYIDKNTGTKDIINQLIIYLENIIKANLGDNLYEKYRYKFIFAIAVNSIECWLLPLVYQGKDKSILKKKAATKDCKKEIEKEIEQSLQKERMVYDTLSRGFMRQKTLFEVYPQNPSLYVFVENLKQQFS
ncbi:MAG: hypothetical protein RLZZ292_795 [Bacteroidota bacterium]|jgi:hypothetical protein